MSPEPPKYVALEHHDDDPPPHYSFLEHQLECELKLTRRICAGDSSKAAIGDIAIGRLVVYVMEQVKGFGAELQLRSFAPEVEGLLKAEVGIKVRIGTQLITRDVAIWSGIA
jgi:hypothetical protein